MKALDLFQSWYIILKGRKPLLSIEITWVCPLRCPGRYSFDEAHLSGHGVTLFVLSDLKQGALVEGVLKLVNEYRPMYVSLVGGDPLVGYRELEKILPKLEERGIYVQLVTGGFRPIPEHWTMFSRLDIVVSVDGLQPDQEQRWKPAPYERILQNIRGGQATIHCTITVQMVKQRNYFRDFLAFWSQRPEVKRIWMSIFAPQQDAVGSEILTALERVQVIEELGRLRMQLPLLDMNESVLSEYLNPPSSPEERTFARTTQFITADLTTRITPCQFGGKPDRTQCGCMASMDLAAVSHLEIIPGINIGNLYHVSERFGNGFGKLRDFQKKVA
jgi:organic radical activating enzyme